MQFLQLRSPSAKTVRMQDFGGYWPSANALPQQFYEMENMAGGGEPHALPRAPRIKVGHTAAAPDEIAACSVTVSEFKHMELKGLLYDAEGKSRWVTFNTADPAAWTTDAECGRDAP